MSATNGQLTTATVQERLGLQSSELRKYDTYNPYLMIGFNPSPLYESTASTKPPKGYEPALVDKTEALMKEVIETDEFVNPEPVKPKGHAIQPGQKWYSPNKTAKRLTIGKHHVAYHTINYEFATKGTREHLSGSYFGIILLQYKFGLKYPHANALWSLGKQVEQIRASLIRKHARLKRQRTAKVTKGPNRRLKANRINKRPIEQFTGIWTDDAGRIVAYSVPRAVKELGTREVWSYIRKPIPKDLALAGVWRGDRLPTEPRPVPGGKVPIASVTAENIERVRTARAALKHRSKQKSRRQTAEEVCKSHGVTSLKDRLAVRSWLTSSVPAESTLRAGNGNRKWNTAATYDPRDVQRAIGSHRTIVDAAKSAPCTPQSNGHAQGLASWSLAQSDGHAQPAAVTAKIIKPRRERGRPRGTFDPSIAQRDAAMRDAYRGGRFSSIAELSRHFHISRTRASKIVNS
jgi:hypothetical protein